MGAEGARVCAWEKGMHPTKLLTWYGGGVVGFFIFAFVLGSLSPMRTHYQEWKYKQAKAREYVTTEVCTNPTIRAKLGEHNLCDQSQTIMDTWALEAAFFKTMKDIQFCKDGGCYLFWIEITSSIWKIAVTGVVILVIAIALGFLRLNHQRGEYLVLPGAPPASVERKNQ